MAETLELLASFLGGEGTAAKVVVWAHNSHMGDARATQMGAQGETNLGQRVRERHGRNAVLIGCTTFEGTVSAASRWNGPAERKSVRPALAGSYEALFHEAGMEALALVPPRRTPRGGPGPAPAERTIGVIYRPEAERTCHYFHASLAVQFDALLPFRPDNGR